MHKYKAKKEVIEQVTSKLQANKIEKAITKYISKKYENGHWVYKYNKDRESARKKIQFCTSKPLDVNIDNALQKGEEFIKNWQKDWTQNRGKSYCSILGGKRIEVAALLENGTEGISLQHFGYKGSGKITKRDNNEILERARLLPFAKEMLESSTKGIINKVRDENGDIYYEILGKCRINGKEEKICVIISELKDGIPTYLSLINKAIADKTYYIKDIYLVDKDKKNGPFSADQEGGETLPQPSIQYNNQKNVSSSKRKNVQKSFDIMVTDITEGNKDQKLKQVQKALKATLENKPFVIKHISEDGTKKLNDVQLRIFNFDSGKIEKAVHSMALSLDCELPVKGEAFMYKSQEELTNQIVKELTDKTNEIYSFVIDYFDLPEIRVVSKSFLKHRGKILYDPETGIPVKKEDWKRFVKALEEFLNRNYSGVGKRIIIKAQSLGRMLNRLSKAKSLSDIKKMPLKDLEVNHRKFDWISATAKNMQNALGESVTDRRTQASIQIAIDSAAQRVTKITDNMRNDIQQIIIDGVRDHSSKTQVSQKLFDKCVGLNRDFQRIADSEIQSTVNMAYLKEEVYHTKEGEKVYFKRFEHDDEHTCKKCRAIKGVIALWSDTSLPDENIDDEFAEYAIWEGKTDGELPATILHPYCRGSWYRYYPRNK